MSKYRVVCGLVKRGEERRNDGEEGEDEFIHQVSLRVHSVLHCSSGCQSHTGSGLSWLTWPQGWDPRPGPLWAPLGGPPSPPGPVSPGYECWSPPETCTSAPEAHWWDLPHTGREGAAVVANEGQQERWVDEMRRKGGWCESELWGEERRVRHEHNLSIQPVFGIVLENNYPPTKKHLHTIMNCKMQKKNYNHLMKAFLSLDEQRSEY